MAKSLPVSPLAPERFPEIPPVRGARWASLPAGLRYRGRDDLMLIELAPAAAPPASSPARPRPATRSSGAAPILPRGKARAVIVNAGNANVFRGAEGDAAVRAEAEAVAGGAGVRARGGAGRLDRRDRRAPAGRAHHRQGAATSPRPCGADGIEAAARAIMTTDTFPKGAFAAAEIDGAAVTIAGIAKGSGMIAPDMATMLAFVVTDAAIAARCPAGAPRRGRPTARSTRSRSTATPRPPTRCCCSPPGRPATRPSTAADDPRLAGFAEALDGVLLDLALQVVRDGEGAQKLIGITVRGAVDAGSARRIGLAIANSPLVKTAIAGGDANWGRVVMAVGKSGEPVDLRPAGRRLRRPRGGPGRGGGRRPRRAAGRGAPDAAARSTSTSRSGPGPARPRVWTCDLTHGYIDINADYRS